MRYFPQLANGTIAQYPLTVREQARSIQNLTEDGGVLLMEDPAGSRTTWDLSYSELSSPERGLLEQFFQDCEGQLQTFTFLDPTDNLLAFTNDLSAAVWQKDALIGISKASGDPFGGSEAFDIVNGGQASQSVSQTVFGAGWYRYCFSLYLESAVPTFANLTCFSGGAQQITSVQTGPTWRRFSTSCRFSNQADGVAFGISLDPGNRVSVFGPQVEAQIAPGVYQRNAAGGGVYPKCRFTSDTLDVVESGPEQNSCRFSVTSLYQG